jgi:hypothetical protein
MTAVPFDNPVTWGLPIGVPGLASAVTSNFWIPGGKLGSELLLTRTLSRILSDPTATRI